MNLPVEHLCLAGILYTSFVLYGLRTRMHIYIEQLYIQDMHRRSLYHFPGSGIPDKVVHGPLWRCHAKAPLRLGE